MILTKEIYVTELIREDYRITSVIPCIHDGEAYYRLTLSGECDEDDRTEIQDTICRLGSNTMIPNDDMHIIFKFD